jgi:uncharacterized protein (DUF427 family)
MKAKLAGLVLAESDDIVEEGGYHYVPLAMVRSEWLKKAPKTERDRACPHGVEFYDDDVDGTHAERTAWMYEAS